MVLEPPAPVSEDPAAIEMEPAEAPMESPVTSKREPLGPSTLLPPAVPLALLAPLPIVTSPEGPPMESPL